VSVICGRHTQKDKINRLGCQKFADETSQKLTHFYPVDKWGKKKIQLSKLSGKSLNLLPSYLKHQSNEIDYNIQQEIWKLRYGATKNLANRLTFCSAISIHSTPMFIKIFINYIFALQVIYIFIFELVLTPALYLFDVLIYNTYYQIIHCYKDLNYVESETTKTTGDGPSYGLNYDDLSSYSNQIKSDVKYSFYTYVFETEKHLFESTDLIAISNIPLDYESLFIKMSFL